jgi:hypothetical protein
MDLNAERQVEPEVQFIRSAGTHKVTCVELRNVNRKGQDPVVQMVFETAEGLRHYARVGDYRVDQLARATGHTDTMVPINLIGEKCYITLTQGDNRLDLFHIHAGPECDIPITAPRRAQRDDDNATT